MLIVYLTRNAQRENHVRPSVRVVSFEAEWLDFDKIWYWGIYFK